MNQAANATKTVRHGLEENYSIALNGYLAGADEAALRRAYELGRDALAAGTSLLDLSALHHAALARALEGSRPSEKHARRIQAAGEFLAESLSPYQMAHLGIREANTTLRQLNEKLEQEARRIAHALHDEAGQLLAVVHVSLADISRDAQPALRNRFQQVTQYLHQVEDQLRRLSRELRPTILDDLGLVPALEFLADGFAQRSGLRVTLRTALESRLPVSVETALYRVVQEALTNAGRHSHARNVNIHLRRDGQTLHCSIRDDGVGFDVPAALARKGDVALGLRGILERVGLIGGDLQIESAPGGGTELRITVPVDI